MGHEFGKWNTEGWRHNPNDDEPEIIHTAQNGKEPPRYPQFCSFIDQEGKKHLISRMAAIAQGLIGMNEVGDWSMSWEEYGKLMEQRRKR